MQLFHSTSADAALHILSNGFADADFLGIARGACFSDRPLDLADGVAKFAEIVLVVEVPPGFNVEEYEVVEEGRPADAYREWLIPAGMVNAWPRQVFNEF